MLHVHVLQVWQVCASTAGMCTGIHRQGYLDQRPQDGHAAMSAPVCSSWVYINQSVARRSTTRPLGDQTNAGVHSANVMVGRVLLLQFIFAARWCFSCVEQPLGSLMQHHPLFQRFLNAVRTYRVSVEMKDFDLPAVKPTWLYASHACVSDVRTFRATSLADQTCEMSRQRIDKLGRRVVDGGADLKKSQAYTRRFAWAMYQARDSRKDTYAFVPSCALCYVCLFACALCACCVLAWCRAYVCTWFCRAGLPEEQGGDPSCGGAWASACQAGSEARQPSGGPVQSANPQRHRGHGVARDGSHWAGAHAYL